MLEGMRESDRDGVWWFRSGLVLLLLVALGACQRGQRLAWVDQVVASEADVAGHPWLGIGPEGLKERTFAALDRTGKIGTLEKGATPPGDASAWSARLEITYVRTLPPVDATVRPDAGHPLRAEVAVELALGRGASSRVVAEGRAQRDFAPGDPEVRAAAFSEALDGALDDASGQLVLLLDAATRTDSELVAELSSEEGPRRDFALRALAERKSPAALPYLLQRLEETDRTAQLRAVGGLVALRDIRAVPKLIEATLGRDPSFVVQIAYALGEIGGEEAEAYLFTASTGHPEEGVRRAAAEALAGLRSRQSEAETRRTEVAPAIKPGPAPSR